MRRGGAVVAIVLSVGALASGCGSGSNTAMTGSRPPRGTPSVHTPVHRPSPGVGWTAPVSKTVGFRRVPRGVGRLPGTEGIGAKGCQVEEGRGEIGIFTDEPQPSCVRVSAGETVSVVNRTGAYHRSEGHPITLGLGPYRARLGPQQAIRFAPVGRFLGRGYHQVRVGSGGGGIGILVLPSECAIRRPEPGEALCFAGERAGRLRRWHRTLARMGAPACRASELRLSAERHDSIGSGGTIYTRFFVSDRSSRPCTIAGVPKVIGLDRRGKEVGVGEAVPLLSIGSKGGRLRVRIAPGEGATFLVSHYDGIGAGRCRYDTASGVRVSIPGTGLRKFMRRPMGYCPAPGSGLGLRVGRIEATSSSAARRP
jgi:hypothetical protein